jgi:hypothetical protein
MDLRELILAARDVPEELMSVPEWPDENGQPVQILVRGFDAHAYKRVMRTSMGAADGRGGGALALMDQMTDLVVQAVCNPATGLPVFTSADLEALERKNGAVINRIVERILVLSGMGPKGLEEAKDFSERTAEPAS